jgi:hypothetical protein
MTSLPTLSEYCSNNRVALEYSRRIQSTIKLGSRRPDTGEYHRDQILALLLGFLVAREAWPVCPPSGRNPSAASVVKDNRKHGQTMPAMKHLNTAQDDDADPRPATPTDGHSRHRSVRSEEAVGEGAPTCSTSAGRYVAPAPLVWKAVTCS